GLELSPVTLKQESGVRQILLAHNSILDALSNGNPVFINVDPTLLFKNIEKNLCHNCLTFPSPGLESLFSKSPYALLLLQMKFVELTKEIGEILNEDWIT
ncbi:hypothetical protein BX616_008150, partial [Lobosporangium transversale]